MRFRILGPLEVWTGEDWSGIGAPKWRALLAALLLNPGQVVSTERLIAELWDDEPPAKAANLISVYVLKLRRLLGDRKGAMLATRSPGYQLLLGPGDLDAHIFESLAVQGRQALAEGDATGAAVLLGEALGLWRGAALADVPPTGLVTAEADRLQESRLTALELRAAAELRCGRAGQLVPELRRLISDHPLREAVWALLMRALDDAGRRAEAIAAYGEARRVLSDELGVDPGPELRQLYHQFLAAGSAPAAPPAPTAPELAAHVPATPAPASALASEPAAPKIASGPASTGQAVPEVAGPEPAAPAAAAPGQAVPAVSAALAAPAGEIAAQVVAPQADPSVPAQLPADIAEFTGRASHLRQLRGLLVGTAGAGYSAAVTVAVVAGTPGLGKTALAVHAAHELRRDFPGGQLYVSLRGASSQPAAPEEVLARMLRDLGVKPAQIPVALEERAALYRTRLADRRALIVLDDARDAAQVRPLLPGSGSCAVIVTSRHRLADLAGSRLIDLDVLDDDEARGLLIALIGEERAAAEPGPVRDVLDACAGLPLAIRIAGARLTARRGWAVRTLARRLADQRRRVDELTAGDLAVRACFDVSFDALRHLSTGDGVDPAHAFRLLGVWQGSWISLPAAAALLGQPEDLVADALEILVDAHLLESPEPEWYGFHDLLRVYAAERAQAQEPAEEIAGAVSRILRWYLRTADRGASIVAPYRERVPLEDRDGDALGFTTADEALDWCALERANLVAVTRQAAVSGLHDVAWKLPVAAMACFDRLGYRTEWGTAHLVALSSARAIGDQHGEAWVLNNIGMVLSLQGAEEARSYLDQAMALHRQRGDQSGQAQAANNIAFDYQLRGMFEPAVTALLDALDLNRRAGNRYGEGVALCNLGENYLGLGQSAEAIAYGEQALPIARQMGSTRLEAYVLDILGRAHLESGHVSQGAELLEQALAIHSVDGDKAAQAMTLQYIGDARLTTGELELARQSWTKALWLFQALENGEQAAQVRVRLDKLSPQPTAASQAKV